MKENPCSSHCSMSCRKIGNERKRYFWKEDYWQNPENLFFRGGHFWRAKSKKWKKKLKNFYCPKSFVRSYPHIIGSASWPKKKELWIPPIWGCWGPTGDSFFTHEQIKHPPFFEGRWYTGKIICQIWAEWAVCLDSYLWKGWMFYLSIGKKLTSSRSTTTPDRWYQKFFFFLADWHFQWCVALIFVDTLMYPEEAIIRRKWGCA